MVEGSESPLMAKPLALIVACEIVTGAPPVLVKVSERLLLPPSWTLPKSRLAGLGESMPCVAGTPVPERLSTVVEFTCSEVVVKVMLPVKVPLDGGAKVTVASVESPVCKVSGRVRLLRVKPAPLRVARLMVRSLPPEFDKVTVLV